MNSVPAIDYLFEPRTVAVIGASANKGKIGYKIVENIVTGGYAGRVYPVNPHGSELLGWPVYQCLADIDAEIDVATIAIPAKFVFEAVRECAARQVKYLSIITSGFSEVGDVETEHKIVNYALDHGMRVLGPNIFGIYSAQVSLNATFGPPNIQPGNVAIITQSGALGVAMIGKTAVENIGVSAIVSVGNKADIDEADLLAYLARQEATRVILMYVEGVKDGERLIGALQQTTQRKPVIVIKSGRSKRGAVAAASHTGSLAGADEIFDDIMRQCGVLRAENLQEALDWCKFLADAPVPPGRNTVIITNGGGIGVMATDACEKYDVNLYDEVETLHRIFSPVTPNFGSTKNPVDLTGQATAQDYDTALEAALKQDRIDAVIALYCETAVFDADNLARMIETNAAQYKAAQKPIVFSILGGETVEQALAALRKKRAPVFPDVYAAVSCLGMMYTYQGYLRDHIDQVKIADIDVEAIERVAQKALREGRSFLLAHEAQQIMQLAGVQIPRSQVARNLLEVVKYAEEIGYPVVLKIVSKDILHKSDAGGVALDLEDRDEVIDAYQAIMHNCRLYKPRARIDGVEVSEMVQPGVELIVGARRDQTFGPIVMFGLGGIYVEVMKDVSFRAAPVNHHTVMSMLKQIRSYPLLLGVRGEGRKDIRRIIDTITKLATIIQKCQSISDIEINPLVVYEEGQGTRAVDARILVSKVERGDSHG
jgi:acetyl coenzyme A synthetase (ADP forming)-like protein